ncbi:outer membrane beta-barrel protein [Microbulbifer hydrolyticus]|uniref:Outer membrane beta-barrel protein n=1 Tax=Microbulbifer hydrolyticus TaxID=48074 RepID=A0A6P1TFW2_9GAMM|nr:outer membrane beta-barrel protein [Microbulbifer hydrolyticus]MBB5211856.1 hypothetical protein [Microbulbifer hydrolyticus]QHQ40556.1 outer membrane beta-barrel protein [Microbulbifer hydrolyticus]
MNSAVGVAMCEIRDKRKSPLWARATLVSSLVTIGQVAHAVTIDLPANAELTSTVNVELQYDDNVFLSRESPQDDWLTRVSPSMSLEREGDATSFFGGLTITRGNYRNGTRQNFNDYAGNVEWQWRAASLLQVHTSASYSDVAQSILGSQDGGLDPVLLEAERTRRPSAEVSLVFGRQGGKFQGILRQGKQKNEFDDSTRDFSADYSTISASYSVSSRFTAGVQVSDTKLDYGDIAGVPARDSDETVLMATAEYRLPKTQLLVRAGRLDREFAPGVRENFTGPRWDILVTWSPRSYSTLSFTTGKNIQESVGVADFVDVKSNVVSWTHQWTGRLSSSLAYSQTSGEFVGTNRSDDVVRSNFTLRYQPMEWLGLSIGAVNVENRTTLSDIDIETNRYILGIEAPL